MQVDHTMVLLNTVALTARRRFGFRRVLRVILLGIREGLFTTFVAKVEKFL
jgi:hypothetical protein